MTTVWSWLGWQRLAGLILIVVGLFLVNSFIKPYVYLAFSSTPLEDRHPVASSAGNRPGSARGRIFIPSIKLSAPLIADIGGLEHGIMLEPAFSLPGREGNTVLTGHNLQRNGHVLFSLLHLVNIGEEIIVHPDDGKRYLYQVTRKQIVEPQEIHKFKRQTKDERLTLITCYPPTTTAMRLVVIAKPEK